MNDPFRPLPQVVAPAPRPVPARLVWQLRLGSVPAWIGWALLATGSLLVWGLASAADLRRWPGETRSGLGLVLQISDSGVAINKRRVHDVLFLYEDAGVAMTASSFSNEQLPEVGAQVPIVVPMHDPRGAWILGLRRAVMPGWVPLAMLVFPVIGLVFVVVALSLARRSLRLLREGVPALGRLLERRETNVTINKRKVFVLTFEFAGELERRFRAEVRTHLIDKLVDDAEEPLLYDPRDPRRATTLDHLPGAVRLDEQGQLLASVPAWRARAVWILPAVTLLVHVVAIAALMG